MYSAIDELRLTIEAQWQQHVALKRQGTICPYVFHREGEPIKTYRRSWLTACTRAGCPGRIPHDFRRTAVPNLVRAGVSEQVAMRMTGHKTRSVFDRYDIVSGDDLRQASAKLNASLSMTGTISGTIARSAAGGSEGPSR
jgi:integrase